MSKYKKVYNQATAERLTCELAIANKVNPPNDKWKLLIHWIEEVYWKSTTSSNNIGIIGTYTYIYICTCNHGMLHFELGMATSDDDMQPFNLPLIRMKNLKCDNVHHLNYNQ